MGSTITAGELSGTGARRSRPPFGRRCWWLAIASVATATMAAKADVSANERPAPLSPPGSHSVVQTGLDVVVAEKGGALRGKRVGLVVHAASVTADGLHAIEVLRRADVKVVRLFTPEHGLRSRAAAGEKVGSGIDAETGLPIVSLYGTKTKPAAEDLAGLDAIVFDLQDAGVRFYTYSGTLLLCLEAAADAGLELVVLDRPNPLGGERVEGPQSTPDVAPSLVNMAPGPLVHGLTFGEMARYVNARRSRPARLAVVAMKGWTRSMLWADTGRVWLPPSPNLRTPEAAIAYPGTALLEATNVSEGRGTDAPFLLLGAPWLASERIVRSVQPPGFTLAATRFTPLSSPAAPDPKHLDTPCAGLRVSVSDARDARPYELGVRLLDALRRQPQFRWRSERALDRLVGTSRLRQALERDETVEAILAADRGGIEGFRRERRAALLY